MIKNILLDRDGTIIAEQHYLHDPDQVILLPNAGPTLQAMHRAGLDLFLVTNQSGIGRGYFGLKDFQAVQDRLCQLLMPYQVRFREVIFCPHTPEDCCTCRKPAPGMWDKLAARFALRPKESLMIGDKMVDIRFARNAKLDKAILLLTGHGDREAKKHCLPASGDRKWIELPALENRQERRGPDLVARDLQAAWEWIQTRLA